MLNELVFGNPSKFEEILSKLNLFFMCLMIAFSNNLFNCILFSALFVLSQPNQWESTSTEKSYLFKPVREPISKGLHLFVTHIIRITSFFLPFDLNLLQWVIFLSMQTTMSWGVLMLNLFGTMRMYQFISVMHIIFIPSFGLFLFLLGPFINKESFFILDLTVLPVFFLFWTSINHHDLFVFRLLSAYISRCFFLGR